MAQCFALPNEKVDHLTSEPLELLGVIEGNRVDEQRLHAQSPAERVYGEWFTLSPYLIEALPKYGIIPGTAPKKEPFQLRLVNKNHSDW